jgi:hypothetical protein
MTRFLLACLEGIVSGVTIVIAVLIIDWIRDKRARAKANRR